MKLTKEMANIMKTIFFTLLFSFFLTCISASVTANQGKSPKGKVPRVVVASVDRQSVPQLLKYIGNIKAWKSAAIKARVTGYVMSYHFREGE